jgi:glycosyltransferase involved in cell wall biosynthesis
VVNGQKSNRTPVCLLVVGTSPARIGGMEILLKETCRQLRERGWTMVVALEHEATPVLLEYFRDFPEVRFVVAPNYGSLAPRQIPMFWKVLREARPQMVVYLFNGILRFLPWVAFLQRVRRIKYWEQSSKPVGYVPQPFPLGKRLAARLLTWPIDCVTTISKYTAECLVAQGIYPAGHITVVHSGVPFDSEPSPDGPAAFRRLYGIPPDASLLMQVSWLVPEKGIDMLLRIFRRVLDTHPRTHLAIVGHGPKQAEYEGLARQIGVAESVHFTGRINDMSMKDVFAAADIYCQMSQWEEALGLVVTEAQAVGRPVVATRVGGIPELVLEGETGYLVGRQDEAAAAARLIEMLDDPARRKRMGEAARQYARSNFELGRNVTRLLDAWQA